MSLFEVFAGLIRVCAGTAVSVMFARTRRFEGQRRVMPSGRDLRDVMVAHLCAILGLGSAMCTLAAVSAATLHGFI